MKFSFVSNFLDKGKTLQHCPADRMFLLWDFLEKGVFFFPFSVLGWPSLSSGRPDLSRPRKTGTALTESSPIDLEIIRFVTRAFPLFLFIPPQRLQKFIFCALRIHWRRAAGQSESFATQLVSVSGGPNLDFLPGMIRISAQRLFAVTAYLHLSFVLLLPRVLEREGFITCIPGCHPAPVENEKIKQVSCRRWVQV